MSGFIGYAQGRKRKSPDQNVGYRKKPYKPSLTQRMKSSPALYKGGKKEVKTVDSTIASLQFCEDSVVANSMRLLNLVPQDASPNGRIGKRITAVAVSIKGNISMASASIADKVMLALVWIRTPNQASTLPAFTDIFAAQDPNAQTNRDNASKFKILRRWEHIMVGNITTPSVDNVFIDINEYVSLKGKQSVWTNSGTAGTIGQFEKGALILCACGLHAFGATTTPLMNGFTRFYFYDE